MELFTMDRQFIKQEVIDNFNSAIWTERYYGDGDCELLVAPTLENIQLLAKGTFLGLKGSSEIMMLETQEIEEEKLKVTGISLEQWLNNRFIRASAAHEDRNWPLTGTPGQIITTIVQQMCISGPFITGASPNGISMGQFVIPNLSIGSTDSTGSAVTVAVPYGPMYDALKAVATTYQVGMKLTMEFNDTLLGVNLKFSSYRGIDRTSAQHVNPVIRFSADKDSLSKIKELQSIANYKTAAYSFAPSNPGGLATTPGSADVGAGATGFDLRAMLVFADDLTTDNVGGDAGTLLSILNSRAADALNNNKMVQTVDGEVVPGNENIFGTAYNLGDLVEVQGYSGLVDTARVTEYIRSQDDSGERAYPTLAATTG